MELVKVGEKTYYIKNNTNIGIYKVDDKNIYLIDTGNDKEAGRKIMRIIEENNWKVLGIINTHSNADHIGGNSFIQNKTNCLIYSSDIENKFTEYPILEPSFLYGSYPFKDLQNKFIMAKPSAANSIEELNVKGLDIFNLKGHFFNMIGIKTSDNIYFLADSIFSKETIEKYHLFYIYNVEEYLETLNYLDTLNSQLFIPSHIVATNDIKEIIKINKEKIEEISNYILKICIKPKTLEEILKNLFDDYNLSMSVIQYYLISSTIKAYITYLYDNNQLEYYFENNKMFWKKVICNQK